ncbi:MAG: MazG-like family protein [Pseudomonadota bacterium]|nr:MazG-like family protein [Pseudomonadota bacterium]
MKCALCDRELKQTAHWIGGQAIGPKCFNKRFGAKKISSHVIRNPQEDLFMSYAQTEMKIVQWGEKRKIIQNSNNMAQAIKTLEEVTELLESIQSGDRKAQKDAYGDILVTLIIGCATADFDLVECLNHAYEQIKDRKGYLTPQGVFVKETN